MNAELEILPDIEYILQQIPSSVYNDISLKQIHDSLSTAAPLINRMLDVVYLSEKKPSDPIRIRIVSCLNLFARKMDIHFLLFPYTIPL